MLPHGVELSPYTLQFKCPHYPQPTSPGLCSHPALHYFSAHIPTPYAPFSPFGPALLPPALWVF